MFNNVIRTCIEAMAATQGHTQSLHTNALDEALALPTDFSARIARNTQLLLQQETGTTRSIDPWGGSYYVERLTHDLARRAWAHIQEVEAAGGMARAIEAGIPKLRIEEAAARTQARIDSGRQPVIGVNKYRPRRDETDRRAQGRQHRRAGASRSPSCERLRAERDERGLPAALGRADRGAAETRPRATCWSWPSTRPGRKATVGEISDALEKVYGRHAGRDPHDHRRVPQGGRASPSSVRRPATLVETLRRGRGPPAAHPGRQDGPGRPRPRPEGHRHRLRRPRLRRRHRPAVPDAGRGRPARRSRTTCTSSGVSSLAAGHLTLVPALRAGAGEARAAADIMIVVGGVIPPQDFDALHAAGAAAIFPPGTVIAEAARRPAGEAFGRAGA